MIPPGGKNDSFNPPMVPGSAKWTTASTGMRAGQSFFVSFGLRKRKTITSAASITMAVRDPLANAPRRISAAAIHQRRPDLCTKYTAKGRMRIIIAPRAMGCCEDPNARSPPEGSVRIAELSAESQEGEQGMEVVENVVVRSTVHTPREGPSLPRRP